MTDVLYRSQWSDVRANFTALGPSNEAVQHHTGGAGPGNDLLGYLRALEHGEMTRGDGLIALAYHWLVVNDGPHAGTRVEVRPWQFAGGATLHHNTTSRAVVVTGDFTNEHLTAAALDSLAETWADGMRRGFIAPNPDLIQRRRSTGISSSRQTRGSDASSPPKYATTACACPVRSGTATRATTSSSSPRSCTAVTYCVSCAASSAGACGTRSNTSSASKGSRPTNRTATLSPATPRGCCYDRDPMSTNGTDLMRVHPRDRRLLPHGRGRDGNRPHHGLCGSSVQALDVAAYMVGGSGIRQRQSPVGVQRAPGRSSMGAADQLESHPGATRRERGGPAGVVRGTAGVARPASSLTAAEAGCWC
jgi:hypothetical protein